MSKIYCAGASAEADMIAEWMVKLRAHGFEVTHDWVADLKANLASGKPDALLTDEERSEYAAQDLVAIARADIFWLLAPEPGNNSTGAWLELGAALTQQEGLNIIVSGPGRKRCIFVSLADHQFDRHDDAYEFILATSEGA